MFDFFSGKDDVELTDDLIKELVENGKLKDFQSGISFKEMGFKWNAKRSKFVLDTEEI